MASLVVGAPALPTMMTPQALNFSSRLSYSQSPIPLSHSTSSSVSLSTNTSTSLPFVYCGRGDRKTAKGKRFSHSFGNARPKDKKKGRGPPRIPVPSSPPKPDKFDDDEVVKIEIDESPFSG